MANGLFEEAQGAVSDAIHEAFEKAEDWVWSSIAQDFYKAVHFVHPAGGTSTAVAFKKDLQIKDPNTPLEYKDGKVQVKE